MLMTISSFRLRSFGIWALQFRTPALEAVVLNSFTKSHHDVLHVGAIVNAEGYIQLSLALFLVSGHSKFWTPFLEAVVLNSFTKSHHDVPYVGPIVNADDYIQLSLAFFLVSGHCNFGRLFWKL